MISALRVILYQRIAAGGPQRSRIKNVKHTLIWIACYKERIEFSHVD